MMGAVSATAVAVGLTPAMANAASSQTYFIGFPSWLPIGAGSTLPSDSNAISAAIIAAKDTNPLIAWGTGGVNLQPVWVTYVDGVPTYTLGTWGQTGSHTQRVCVLGFCKNVSVPDYGWVTPGKWTTTTAGQWVSPSDLSTLPTAGQLAYLVSAAQNGDTGALAPLLNWTAYFTNVNLIAYGDGAIAAGQAYQSVIDSAKNGTFPVGEALTGPRQIAVVGPDGKVTLVTVYDTN
ncbi:MAG: hypothetical protein QOJ80_577, partial [Mycobacterium sp.]|nr:hypothetical protein [Mycobacterium sp.]